MQAALDRYLRSKTLCDVSSERYRVPIFKESARRKGEKTVEARNRGTVKQREKPDQGRRGDTVGERSVRQPDPSLFDKHQVVDTNNAFWFTWSKGASCHDGRRLFNRKG